MQVLVNREELETLRNFYEAHSHCRNSESTLQKSGKGYFLGPSGDCIDPSSSEPNLNSSVETNERDNRVTEIIKKDILVPNKVSVEPEQQPEKKDPVTTDVIVSAIRKNYQKKAALLLQQLKQFPDKVSFNSHGIVSIDGDMIPGLSIIDAISVSMYPVKEREIAGISQWANLIKELHLQSYVENPMLFKDTIDTFWYFLGEIA